ncbi:hypothetical protein [Oceaniradius stylonematis]|jgi:hypothetical protein|uniref:hypothetical protein n=1 Tax=Oceaniradius stylonematis TaxID=2184161 RepID=UPI0035CF36D7
MTDALQKLIEAAKTVEPSSDASETQRRSFAYGNTKFENSKITREMVAEQADILKKNKGKN